MEQGWLSFLWEYVRIIKEFWWVLVPDAVMIVIDLIEKARGKEVLIRPVWMIRIFVVALVLAQLLAYRDLKGKTEGLVGEIEQISHGADEQGNALAIVEMNVSNGGNPTVAKGYKLHVKFGVVDKEYYPTPIPISGLPVIGREDNKKHITLTPSDQLSERTSSPIPTGGDPRGVLCFLLDGIKIKDLEWVTVTWEVSFRDAFRHQYVASKTVENHSINFPFVFVPESPEVQFPH